MHLLLRLVFNIDRLEGAFSLFSVTFIWVTPMIIGMIPLFYASKEQLISWSYRIASPIWTVVVFFLFCFLTRIEDLICLLVILIPYMLGALIAGIIAGEIILRIRNRKGIIYTFLLIPFIASPFEQQISKPVNSYSVTTKIIINAKPDSIWKNIIRVSEINESEYESGFFNYAGIPRPLYAELDRDTIGATSIGHFEGGLKFIETVSAWDKNKEIGFDIKVVPSTIRETVFDQHILKGEHFKFLKATYKLLKLPGEQTQLSLISSYELKTTINSYAAYCGNQLLTDFQKRLLKVIKTRCNKL
jgi:hypothetical protein